MNKKYELTNESIEYDGVKLYRIKALRDFGDVCNGDLGGFVESEKNLSHEGDCWVYAEGKVMGHGLVSNNAKVFDYGEVRDHGKVCGNSKILEHGIVKDHGGVWCNGIVIGHGEVCDNGLVTDKGTVRSNGVIKNFGIVRGNGMVSGHGVVSDHGVVSGHGVIYDNGKVVGNAVVSGDTEIDGYTVIGGNAVVKSEKDYIVFKNNWSGGRYFTWTRSNNMWTVGCFYGTGEELIKKAYEDSDESGKNYERYVKFIEENFLK